MMKLKQTWLNLLYRIIKSNKSAKIEDYIELENVSVVLAPSSSIEEFYDNEYQLKMFHEMHKVFFSNEENIFGHSYKDAIQPPFQLIKDPIDSVVYLLNKNETTRKAVLTFVPYDSDKVPCITSVQFLIRNKRLNIIYNSRGEDIYNKFPSDAMCVIECGRKIADKLKIKMGSVTANIASAHIYLKDIKNACLEFKKNFKHTILTGNVNKYEKFIDELKDNDIEIKLNEIKLNEIQSIDIEEIAKNKAKSAYDYYGRPMWVDDVAFMTEAFDNFPGPFTKYFFKILDIEDIKMFYQNKSKKAKMICTLCLYDGNNYHIVQGENEGYVDFSRPIKQIAMPLNSIFISSDPMKHRKDAIQKLLSTIRDSNFENTLYCTYINE
ncbi:MAG: non-canonical purine NTP pyrophosphatase [Succinimonas sp.]|nr:non-canonical purine NTP pyrophosphatase [Succinimonas sp.]